MVSGCTRRDTEAAARHPSPPPPDVLLPAWAPENPSPEFLRAARVIEADPPEFYDRPDEPDLTMRIFWAQYSATLPLAWELFGTLTDGQVERLLSTKNVRIPVTSLSRRQRELLDEYFEVWRQVMKGAPRESRDWLVEIYKIGAEEDLSNIDLTYRISGKGIVAMILRLRPSHEEASALGLPARLGMLHSGVVAGDE